MKQYFKQEPWKKIKEAANKADVETGK